MTVPRCSACNRIAIVEIDTGVFLCRRCEVILNREFPHFRRNPEPRRNTALAGCPAASLTTAKAEDFHAARGGMASAAAVDPSAPGPAAADTLTCLSEMK